MRMNERSKSREVGRVHKTEINKNAYAGIDRSKTAQDARTRVHTASPRRGFRRKGTPNARTSRAGAVGREPPREPRLAADGRASKEDGLRQYLVTNL